MSSPCEQEKRIFSCNDHQTLAKIKKYGNVYKVTGYLSFRPIECARRDRRYRFEYDIVIFTMKKVARNEFWLFDEEGNIVEKFFGGFYQIGPMVKALVVNLVHLEGADRLWATILENDDPEKAEFKSWMENMIKYEDKLPDLNTIDPSFLKGRARVFTDLGWLNQHLINGKDAFSKMEEALDVLDRTKLRDDELVSLSLAMAYRLRMNPRPCEGYRSLSLFLVQYIKKNSKQESFCASALERQVNQWNPSRESHPLEDFEGRDCCSDTWSGGEDVLAELEKNTRVDEFKDMLIYFIKEDSYNRVFNLVFYFTKGCLTEDEIIEVQNNVLLEIRNETGPRTKRKLIDLVESIESWGGQAKELHKRLMLWLIWSSVVVSDGNSWKIADVDGEKVSRG